MLCDIITHVLASQPDMEVVGELADRDGLFAQVTETGADVVVIGLANAELPQECHRLLAGRPNTRVLTVSPRGGNAYLYEVRPQKVALGEISPETLLAAIRGQPIMAPEGE